MESVEDFMVGVTAYLVFIVYKAFMYAASAYELRLRTPFFIQDGTDSVSLGWFFTEYIDFVTVFNFGSDIRHKKFKILVENRLRCKREDYLLLVLPFYRNVEIDSAESGCQWEEILRLVHIRRIQPQYC